MAFIKLSERLGFVWGFRRYDDTPQVNGVNVISMMGNEILDPENINAYDIYSTTPHLYAVIQRRGDLLASGVWKHYKATPKGKELVENSDIVNVLENPSPLYKGNDYLRLLNESKCVFGNTYQYLIRPYKSAFPSVINVLPAHDVRIVRSGKWYKQSKIKDIINHYELISTNERIEVSDIVHTWIQNTKNPMQGESPLKSIYMPLSNVRLAMRFRNTIMEKKGALGILSNSTKDQAGHKNVTSDERTRIENQFHRDFGIQEGKQSVIITSNDLKWQPMSYPTKDFMLFEEDENDFAQICDAFGMKRDLFASTKGATFENQREALKQTYQSTIIPEAEEVALNHSAIFGLDGKKEWLELDFSHIPVLQENEQEKANVMNLKANAISQLVNANFDTKQIETILGVKF
jgi:HK97 family phage portal protein